jgi:hypothetical protein
VGEALDIGPGWRRYFVVVRLTGGFVSGLYSYSARIHDDDPDTIVWEGST